MTGSRTSAITTSRSTIVPTARSVVAVSPVNFMLENRGCRGRIVGRIGLNMLGRVELENSDTIESIPYAGYAEKIAVYIMVLKSKRAWMVLGRLGAKYLFMHATVRKSDKYSRQDFM